jgi:DNA-binding FadR family transcriptional regulator
VVAAAHNEVLSELYADLGDLLSREMADNVGGDLSPENHLDHACLVEAIRTGDGDAAAAEAARYPFICLRGSRRADA